MSIEAGFDETGSDDPELDPAQAYALAKKVVYDRLAERQRSRADLAQALAKRRVPAEVADAVLDRCEAAGLVDDTAFAQEWVRARHGAKGLAPRALAQELRKHGIDDELAAEALSQIDGDSQRAAAVALVERKLRSMGGLDDTTRIRRLTAMLGRKGYAPQLAFDVVREALDAEPPSIEWS